VRGVRSSWNVLRLSPPGPAWHHSRITPTFNDHQTPHRSLHPLCAERGRTVQVMEELGRLSRTTWKRVLTIGMVAWSLVISMRSRVVGRQVFIAATGKQWGGAQSTYGAGEGRRIAVRCAGWMSSSFSPTRMTPGLSCLLSPGNSTVYVVSNQLRCDSTIRPGQPCLTTVCGPLRMSWTAWTQVWGRRGIGDSLVVNGNAESIADHIRWEVRVGMSVSASRMHGED